jgi:DNA-directed RNA polymerase specialized sigma subunit
MTPKEYLEQYHVLDAAIDSKREQIENLKVTATKVSPSSEGSASSSGASDRVGKAVAQLLDLENEIADDIEMLVALKKEILAQINVIPNLEYRYILEEHYFNRHSFEFIAERLGCERSTVCRRHGTALTFITPPEKNFILCNKCNKCY